MNPLGRWWDPDQQRLQTLLRAIGPNPRNNAANPKFQAAMASFQQVRQAFDYTQFTFKRTLGWGGFGVALKYEQVDANQQHVAYAAVKVPRDGLPRITQAFEQEMKYYMAGFIAGLQGTLGCILTSFPFLLQRFEVSEHIPRLLHFPSDLTDEREDGTRALPEGNDQFWTQNSNLIPQAHFAMIMEYLEYGDFFELIYKLTDNYFENSVLQLQGNTTSQKTEVVPNRTMWRFFLCLTRGCIAMAFPRKSEFQLERMIDSQRNPQTNRRRSAIVDRAWREEVDEGDFESHLIHKDLDPGNVFLGAPDPLDAEHSFAPVAKPHPDIAGVLRTGGKRSWHAPEQFEDAIYDGPESFGPWTNIYGIGLIMLSLITRAKWAQSLQTWQFVPTPTRADPDRWCETYGWHLDEVRPWPGGLLGAARSDQVTSFLNYYEKDLRVLDRPSLEELVQTIEAAIQRGNEQEAQGASKEGETNAELEAFYDQFFRSAPEQPDPWEGMYPP
ncbi:kinase-like domain-containing protein [Apiospora marii]|uniref:Kinase-like domain-containing protein n=1 Tax=Apiospora marii TaxID=335849 RepID=A0ABR1REQ5_9PEZI